MPTGIQPEKILKELAGLWAGMSKDDVSQGTNSGVLRACSMTLVVAAESTRTPWTPVRRSPN